MNGVDVVLVAFGVERGGGARCFGGGFGNDDGGSSGGGGDVPASDSLPWWQPGGRRLFIRDYLARHPGNDLFVVVVVIVGTGSFGRAELE